MKSRLGWLLALACLLSVLPARAETTAAHLQSLLWSYGDTGTGWTGGDGTYSVELPDGRVAWLFSDTFLGPVNDDHSRPTNAPFVHNSIVVQDGEAMTTLLPNGAQTLINPPDRVGFYWLGDAIVENGELLVFALRFVAAPIPYGFQQVGTDVARFDANTLAFKGVTRMPLAFVPGADAVPVSYGMSLLRDGGFDYIYGVADAHIERTLYVARVSQGHLLDQPWQYWSTSGWSDLPAQAAELTYGISNELSITHTGTDYVLVAQDHSIGRDIVVSSAPSPEGPWPLPHTAFHIDEPSTLSTYNAKAHEEFSDEHTLVVTYNVNAVNSGDLYANVDNYRPRFVEIPI